MDKVVMVFKGLFGWESTLCVPLSSSEARGSRGTRSR